MALDMTALDDVSSRPSSEYDALMSLADSFLTLVMCNQYNSDHSCRDRSANSPGGCVESS